MGTLYSSLRWRAVRAQAIRRDGHSCTVSRLLGGECGGGSLHAHHIVPVADGGAPFDLDNVGTACPSHHPMWEALRRNLVARLLDPPRPATRCRHRHLTREGRELCERRMARARGGTAIAA